MRNYLMNSRNIATNHRNIHGSGVGLILHNSLSAGPQRVGGSILSNGIVGNRSGFEGGSLLLNNLKFGNPRAHTCDTTHDLMAGHHREYGWTPLFPRLMDV